MLFGARRVGKTYILLQLMDIIKSTSENPNLIYINREQNDFRFLTDAKVLYQYVKAQSQSGVRNYLFIDEIQEIEGFEVALRELLIEDYDIYATGSNAQLLSSDLATKLSGRYIEFRIHPLDYPEFLQFHTIADTEDAFFDYLKYGGMPYLIHLDMKDDVIYHYLKSVYNSIVLKDVVSRYNIRDVVLLDRLIDYLSENLAGYVSSKKITDFIKSQGIKMSINTILNYLHYLSNAFFIQKCSRYDIKGKKVFEINDKYFFNDLGLKNSLVPFKLHDMSKVLENLVYNKLIAEDFLVYVGKWNDLDIDFVAQKRNKTIYIQVAYLLIDEQIVQREFGNLQKIKDNHRKIVVSTDRYLSENEVI